MLMYMHVHTHVHALSNTCVHKTDVGGNDNCLTESIKVIKFVHEMVIQLTTTTSNMATHTLLWNVYTQLTACSVLRRLVTSYILYPAKFL